jgi:protein-serine/threonine kinase
MDNPYQKLEKIGAGSFSTVYKGWDTLWLNELDTETCRIHKETKQLVAIKILNLDTAEDEVADIRTEISLLTQLKLADVQNVTRYYASHLYGSKLWIIMDYCHGGSIRTLVIAHSLKKPF